MSVRRFTRLTNGFLKKIEKHGHAVALHFMRCNFVQVWSMEQLVAIVDAKQMRAA
jgi:hypothetical protein